MVCPFKLYLIVEQIIENFTFPLKLYKKYSRKRVNELKYML